MRDRDLWIGSERRYRREQGDIPVFGVIGMRHSLSGDISVVTAEESTSIQIHVRQVSASRHITSVLHLQQVLEPEHPHSPEVSSWILSLETNVTPLASESTLQCLIRLQNLPELVSVNSKQ